MGSPSQPLPNGEKTAYQLAAEKLPASTREQLYRLFTQAKVSENDPIWAIVGVQAGILQPFVTSQPHVEALNKALTTVERAADRIERRSFYLNLGWPLVAVVLACALTGVSVHLWDGQQEETRLAHNASERANRPVGLMERALWSMGGGLEYRTENAQRRVVLTFHSGDWVVSRAEVAPESKAVAVVLEEPTPAPAVSPVFTPSPKRQASATPRH